MLPVYSGVNEGRLPYESRLAPDLGVLIYGADKDSIYPLYQIDDGVF